MKDTNMNINNKLEQVSKEKEKATAAKRAILEARLEFGSELSKMRWEIPSSKLRGKEIAIRFPASKMMDPALRSDCRWLHEALHSEDHEDGDILKVLGVRSIYDQGSENPTVIRRWYRQAKSVLTQ